MENNWVGYLDRGFIQIKRRILTRLGNTVPEMTDHSDSNILVIIVESFAGVAEMLNYYIDNLARESFITTCRRYSSAVKHCRLIDYRIKAKIPSSADITITLLDADGNPFIDDHDILIPIGTQFTNNNGIPFLSVRDITLLTGRSSVVVPARQKVLVEDDNLGVTTDDEDQAFSLGKDYVDSSVELTIGGDTGWLLKETLGLSGPTDKHFIVDVSANKEAYITFGDNINGAIPPAGQIILANYYTTLGILGNVEIGTINQMVGVLDTTADSVSVYNLQKSVSGTDFEDIDRLRRSAPLSLRTLLRAVTRSDYRDIALLAPGVDKAKVKFNCGKFVYLYIAPNYGGIASTGLLSDVELYFDDKRMVTTFVKALPAGESKLYFDITVTGKFRIDGPQLREDILALLLDAYSYDKSDINKPTRTSDLIALVDNYFKVDYLKLNAINIIPYIRPVGNTDTTQLNYTLTMLNGSTTRRDWKIKYDGLFFLLFRSNSHVATLSIDEVYSDTIITFSVQMGGYTIGSEWTFTTLPVNQDIILDDYSIPVLEEANLELNIIEQRTTS